MMTLWSIFSSPLMIGGEMTGFDEFTMSLLTNTELLKMHENSRHSHQVFRREFGGKECIAWISENVEGGNYLAIFNASDKKATFELSLKDFELYDPISYQEIWSGKKGKANDTLKVSLPAHGAKAYLIK